MDLQPAQLLRPRLRQPGKHGALGIGLDELLGRPEALRRRGGLDPHEVVRADAFVLQARQVRLLGRPDQDHLAAVSDDPAQAGGYDALLEFRDHKPFECVGEGRESRAALAALATRPEWREDALVERFVREILPTLDPDALAIAPQMALEGEHRVPPATWERVRAHFDA